MQDEATSAPLPAAAAQVLEFWFETIDRKHWFGKDAEFDRALETRFGALLMSAKRGELDGWASTPKGMLALIILLDQMSRNIFRDQPGAFEADGAALDLTLAGIAAGFDTQLAPEQRQFFYMPLMHSERLEMQRLSLEKSRELAAIGHGSEKYALMHFEIIERFGRFPHRNAILGRTATPAEEEYLRDPSHRGF